MRLPILVSLSSKYILVTYSFTGIIHRTEPDRKRLVNRFTELVSKIIWTCFVFPVNHVFDGEKLMVVNKFLANFMAIMQNSVTIAISAAHCQVAIRRSRQEICWDRIRLTGLSGSRQLSSLSYLQWHHALSSAGVTTQCGVCSQDQSYTVCRLPGLAEMTARVSHRQRPLRCGPRPMAAGMT